MQKLALAVRCSQVVFEAIKGSDLLRVKNAKINLAKFHMSTVCGREQLNKFSSLAFLLGIAANALGYKGGGVSKPCGTSTPVLATVIVRCVGEGGGTSQYVNVLC